MRELLVVILYAFAGVCITVGAWTITPAAGWIVAGACLATLTFVVFSDGT